MSQLEFSAALLAPERPTPAGLSDAHGAAAGKRFDVYRNNVTVSLIEALEAGFPATQALLGDSNFRNVARVYAQAYPPSSPMMMLYGQGFAAFLAELPELNNFGYLPDVARLEYALRESYNAADADPISPNALAAIPPERLGALRLSFSPAMRLLRSPWPQVSLHRIATGYETGQPPRAAQDALITRKDYDSSAHLLGAGAAMAVQCLHEGKALAEAAQSAMQEAQDFDLSALLALLLSTDSIVKLKLEEST